MVGKFWGGFPFHISQISSTSINTHLVLVEIWSYYDFICYSIKFFLI